MMPFKPTEEWHKATYWLCAWTNVIAMHFTHKGADSDRVAKIIARQQRAADRWEKACDEPIEIDDHEESVQA